jgi:hypothetical protein
MAEYGSPPAARLARPRWRDTRLLLGLLLVAVAVVLGSRVVAASDSTELVWAVTRDLGAGSTLGDGDVERRAVRLDATAGHYLAASSVPTGYVLTRSVGAGELLPAAAVAPSSSAAGDVRLVTVPVQRFHFPADLAKGARVDVYTTPKTAAGTAAVSAPPSERVLANALVAGVERDAGRIAASSSGTGVVLAVAPSDVAALVAALQRGAIDLVRVPAGG